MPSFPLVKHRMAAAVGANTARALKQMMKPHIPMIKFPLREPLGVASTAPVGNPNSLEALITKNVPPGKSTSETTGSSKVTGPSIDASELPIRFRRKPISLEEMEYIEKGGPV